MGVKLALLYRPYLQLLQSDRGLDALQLVELVDALAHGHQVGILRIFLSELVHALDEHRFVLIGQAHHELSVLDYVLLAVLLVIGRYLALQLDNLVLVELGQLGLQRGLVALHLPKKLSATRRPVVGVPSHLPLPGWRQRVHSCSCQP